MSHKSDIGICQFKQDGDNKLTICINGWAICKISFDEDLLIKNKDEAIEIAKGIVSLLEFKYGAVKNEDFPNFSKATPDVKMVKGYEIPQYTEEEWEEREEELDLSDSDAKTLLKLLMLQSMMCD